MFSLRSCATAEPIPTDWEISPTDISLSVGPVRKVPLYIRVEILARLAETGNFLM